jgi:hypothetical protein
MERRPPGLEGLRISISFQEDTRNRKDCIKDEDAGKASYCHVLKQRNTSASTLTPH